MVQYGQKKTEGTVRTAGAGGAAYALAVFQGAQEIVQNVYLTSFVGANAGTLVRLKIKAVINCTSNLPHSNVPGVAYYRAPMEDSLVEMISSYFEPISKIINQFVTKGHPVLIHCQAGVSRSATCLLAHMISHHNYSLRDAIDVMKRRRYLIEPNPFFMEQLVSFEAMHRGAEENDGLRDHPHSLQ